MKLQFFNSFFVTQLRENAGQNLPKYGENPIWLDALSGGKTYAHESNQIVDPPPSLLVTEQDSL